LKLPESGAINNTRGGGKGKGAEVLNRNREWDNNKVEKEREGAVYNKDLSSICGTSQKEGDIG